MKHCLDGREIKWIGGEAIKSVRRNTDDFAAVDEASGVVHYAGFRSLGRYFKNFDGQCSLAALYLNALANYHMDGRAGKSS